jgi:hypothetical protein
MLEISVVEPASLSLSFITLGPPNGPHVKLRGRGPRAEVGAARRLPPMTFVEPSGDLQVA